MKDFFSFFFFEGGGGFREGSGGCRGGSGDFVMWRNRALRPLFCIK